MTACCMPSGLDDIAHADAQYEQVVIGGGKVLLVGVVPEAAASAEVAAADDAVARTRAFDEATGDVVVSPGDAVAVAFELFVLVAIEIRRFGAGENAVVVDLLAHVASRVTARAAQNQQTEATRPTTR